MKLFGLNLYLVLSLQVLGISLCQCVSRFKPFPKQLFGDVLEALQWKHDVALIYSNGDSCVHLLRDVNHHLDRLNTTRIHYELQDSNLYLNRYLNEIHLQYFPNINIIYLVCCLEDELDRVMNISNDFDAKSNKTTDLRSKSHWLVINIVSITDSKFVKDTLTIQDLCHVAIIQTTESENGVHGDLKTLMKTDHGSVFIDVNKPLSKRTIYPNLRFKWNKRHLVIGALPHILLQRRIVNNQSVYYGDMMTLLTTMSTYLNFTYELVEPADGLWGVKTANDSYNGLLGMTQRREIDIMYAEYMINTERQQILDFILPPLSTVSVGLFYKEPRGAHLSNTWLSIFRPFSAEVYIFVSISFLIVSIFYILIEALNIAYHNPLQVVSGFDLLSVVFSLYGCVTLECTQINPRTRSGRILLVCWWFFCILLTATYMANLSSLQFAPHIKTFNNIDELRLSADWKFGLLRGSFLQPIFQNSTDVSFQKAWNKILHFNRTDPSVLSNKLADHINKVMNGKYVFITSASSYYVKSGNDCRLTSTENLLNLQHSSFGVPINSPLKGDIEYFIINALETQIVRYKYNEKRPSDCPKQLMESEIRPMSLDNVKGAFVILSIGISLSFSGLLLEICTQKYLSDYY